MSYLYFTWGKQRKQKNNILISQGKHLKNNLGSSSLNNYPLLAEGSSNKWIPRYVHGNGESYGTLPWELFQCIN